LTARLIPIISPDEAAELTYYGSEVIHPFTMEQVIRKRIPIRIKNVENPRGGGTVIHPGRDGVDAETVVDEGEGSLITGAALTSPILLQTVSVCLEAEADSSPNRKRLPTAVTIKENIVVLNVHSNRKSVSHGFLAGLFSTLDRFGVVVDLITTSEVHVSMAIEDGSGQKRLDRLVRELKKSGTVCAFFLFGSSSVDSAFRAILCLFPFSQLLETRHAGHFGLIAIYRYRCIRTWRSCPSWGSTCGTWWALQGGCSRLLRKEMSTSR